jgi:hypothetical protein
MLNMVYLYSDRADRDYSCYRYMLTETITWDLGVFYLTALPSRRFDLWPSMPSSTCSTRCHPSHLPSPVPALPVSCVLCTVAGITSHTTCLIIGA